MAEIYAQNAAVKASKKAAATHGTADALVGTGKADASSMKAAIRLAMEIVGL